jgi:CBS domain-containing protein
MAMDAAEIMTQPAITVTRETTVAEVAQLMVQNRISGLPVIGQNGEIVGMVTEGDLLRRAETGTERHHARWLEFLIAPGRLATEYAHAHARKVGEVMTADVVSVAPQDSLEHVVELMERRRIKRLPVIDTGRLAGIVSRANPVRALIAKLPKQGEETAEDAEIRDRILAEIAKQPWGPRASVDVSVMDGVADLSGSITDERERSALVVLAENVRGVKAVRDHLIWVEPMSGFVVAPEGDQTDDTERRTGER